MINIVKYNKNMKKVWDNFIVHDARNGNFLFYRDYMEYHADRFQDNSLLLFDEKDILIAIIPASKKSKTYITHEGLTYGGLIYKKNLGTEKILIIFNHIVKYLKESNFTTIMYKRMPYVYTLYPSEEDLYALYCIGFNISRRDVSSCMNIARYSIKGKKLNEYKRGKKNGLSLIKTSDSSKIFSIINKNLNKKYNVLSTHTSDEMNYLHFKFPNNIEMFELLEGSKVVGGIIIYLNIGIVHVQYVACLEYAKKLRGIDFLIISIIKKYKDNYEWFDYGISTEMDGMLLNNSLIKSKEEYGLTALCYDSYELKLE